MTTRGSKLLDELNSASPKRIARTVVKGGRKEGRENGRKFPAKASRAQFLIWKSFSSVCRAMRRRGGISTTRGERNARLQVSRVLHPFFFLFFFPTSVVREGTNKTDAKRRCRTLFYMNFYIIPPSSALDQQNVFRKFQEIFYPLIHSRRDISPEISYKCVKNQR